MANYARIRQLVPRKPSLILGVPWFRRGVWRGSGRAQVGLHGPGKKETKHYLQTLMSL